MEQRPYFNNLKRRAFELCLAIYRVTKLFPPGEILAIKLRESSVGVLVLLAARRINDTILKVEEIIIYLSIAQKQDWISPINFDLLKNAYKLLKEAVGAFDIKAKQTEKEKNKFFQIPLREKKQEEPVVDGIGNRQKIIIDYLQESRQAKVSDLLNILKNVSERTIRNDLTFLIGKSLIKKTGTRKDAKYLPTS